MPVLGKESRKKDLIKHIDDVFKTVHTNYDIPLADFPDSGHFAEKLRKQDFTKFPSYDKAVIERIDKMLSEDLPKVNKYLSTNLTNFRKYLMKTDQIFLKLMMMIPAEESDKSRKGQGIIKGGIFDKVKMPDGKGVDAGIGEKIWIVSRDKPRYDEIFSSLEQHNNKITGQKKLFSVTIAT